MNFSQKLDFPTQNELLSCEKRHNLDVLRIHLFLLQQIQQHVQGGFDLPVAKIKKSSQIFWSKLSVHQR